MSLAFLLATAIGPLQEVRGLADFLFIVWVRLCIADISNGYWEGSGTYLTMQRESWPIAIFSFECGDEFEPVVIVFHHLAISNDIEAFLCARYGHNQPVHHLQETDVVLFVASHKRQQHNLVFFTLIIVN